MALLHGTRKALGGSPGDGYTAHWMMLAKSVILFTCVLLFLPWSASGAQPNSLFTDGGVLQHGMRIPVWGTGRDGEEVTVKCQAQTRTTVVRGGKWRVDL